jgi:hypothetical protein
MIARFHLDFKFDIFQFGMKDGLCIQKLFHVNGSKIMRTTLFEIGKN